MWSAAPFYAAFTGVLLWISAVIAGWFENWATFRRLPEAVARSPRIVSLLGPERAVRAARVIEDNVAALGGNVSLGILLGMEPVIATFFGLPLEVRHVTLSTGQLALASWSYGAGSLLAARVLVGGRGHRRDRLHEPDGVVRAGAGRGHPVDRTRRGVAPAVCAAPCSRGCGRRRSTSCGRRAGSPRPLDVRFRALRRHNSASAANAPVQPRRSAMPSIYDFSVDDIHGKKVTLDKYKNKVMLIVNTASKCGFTPQYKGLEALYEKFHGKGLEVLGFPCNQFGAQEPGTEEEIAQFCELNYGVTFPMFAKVDVNGDGAAPLYKYLKAEKPGLLGSEAIKWNFTKFLVDRKGKVLARYAPNDTPESMAGDIEKAL